MSITKMNKDTLQSDSDTFTTNTGKLERTLSTVQGHLDSIPSHKDFSNLTSIAKSLSNSLEAIAKDYNNYAKNINNYITAYKELDSEELNKADTGSVKNNTSLTVTPTKYIKDQTTTKSTTTTKNTTTSNPTYHYSTNYNGNQVINYSTNPSNNTPSTMVTYHEISSTDVPAGGKYNYTGIEKYLDTVKGDEVKIPEGLGKIYTYMGWQCITAPDSYQYKLRDAAGMNFDSEGFGKIGDRYVVATTTTFGRVGDFIDVYLADGTVLKCVIGDIKSRGDEGCTEYGHHNGQNVIEFVVDKDSWYSSNHPNPGTNTCHPEWSCGVVKIVNKENFWNLIQKDEAKLDSDATATTTKDTTEDKTTTKETKEV